MLARRSFKVDIVTNGRQINYVVIDPHYELKHAGSISDSIILGLVGLLDGDYFLPESIMNGFEYFANDLNFKSKEYRLIWVLEKDQFYVGIINAYRR